MTFLSRRDFITWHPVCTIEKYSVGQVRYAREHGGVPWPKRFALSRRQVLNGDLLRLLFREPEDGTVFDEGNGVTAAGTANLALVLSGLGGYPLTPGKAVFGVGTDAAEFDREQTSLSGAYGEQPGSSFYRPMDVGYPVVNRPGIIEGQATFVEHEACFAWHEWCWGAGPGWPAAHHSLSGAYGGEQPVMMNRKAHSAGYGTKEPGVAWCFRTEIRLS